MANREIFDTRSGPATDAANRERAPAYAYGPKHALAQLAVTGCFAGTFYATAKEQLDDVLALAATVEPEFVAKTAVYARERAGMKDAPALLLATLMGRDGELFERAFFRVVDNGKMLRNFVQIVRSGVVGRRSFGSRAKRLVRTWLERQDDFGLLRASVGAAPSLADVVKMVHPRPADPARRAFYGWLLGREHDAGALPAPVRALAALRAGESVEIPDVPFEMLTSLPLSTMAWRTIAERASWHQARMNLNTFARHGVFRTAASTPLERLRRLVGRGTAPEESPTAALIAARLRSPELVRRAKAFPYQLLAARQNLHAKVPAPIRRALDDAMEIATENVPAIEGRVVVCPDVSGSMHGAAITGTRRGATSVVRCIDVAALVASAMLRRNPEAIVLPFAGDVVPVRLDAKATTAANAAKLAAIGGGATSCPAPVRWLNRSGERADLVLFVSDNQSWVDARAGRGTALMAEWERFRGRNPAARMVCIDIQPYGTTQASEREDILNVGGFSDRVFEVVSEFAAGRLGPAHWMEVIERTEI